MEWKSNVYRFDTAKIQSKIFEVDIPDQKFYKIYQTQKLCPVCSKQEAVVPIIYGFPSEQDFRDGQEGKIYLGGCDIQQCQPKFHCKVNKFSF